MGGDEGEKEYCTNQGEMQEFVAGLALAPPEVQVDEATMQLYNKEMEDAAKHPLPDEDDPDL